MTEGKKKFYICASLGAPKDKAELDFLLNHFPKNHKNSSFLSLLKQKIFQTKKNRITPQSIAFAQHENHKTAVNQVQKLSFTDCLSFELCNIASHTQFLETLETNQFDECQIFSPYPQFSYATIGLIANFFQIYLDQKLVRKFLWLKSYGNHKNFISLIQKGIKQFLQRSALREEETIFIFTALGNFQNRLFQEDTYEKECQTSMRLILKRFPYAIGLLGYYDFYFANNSLPKIFDISCTISAYSKDRKNVFFVPISNCFENEKYNLELAKCFEKISSLKLTPFKMPALILQQEWIKQMLNILDEKNFSCNNMLIGSFVYEKNT